ncbi:MAG: PstS family phosphate ABC transporter substrate-binding protein [Pseudobdellovibrionaceae bacterium]
MKWTFLSFTIASSLVFSSVSFAEASAGGRVTIKADGSSTVFLIAEGVAEEFQKSEKGKTTVTVGSSGTGGGFNKFCGSDAKIRIDVQNASRPIKDKEIAACTKNNVAFYELPVAYDAIVVITNPQNDWMKEISIADLKKIWEPAAKGTIMKWNQVNKAWPDKEIKLYGAGTDSGTFDYFAEAVVGGKATRSDYTASEDDNTLVTGVSKDRYALGFIPIGYYSQNTNKLKALNIIGKSGTAVAPSVATVVNGTYNPLSRPLFIYVNSESYKKPEVNRFVGFFLKNAPQLVEEAKFIPLPAVAYTMAEKRVSKGKLGSMFSGHAEVGLKIEELLAREEKGEKDGAMKAGKTAKKADGKTVNK